MAAAGCARFFPEVRRNGLRERVQTPVGTAPWASSGQAPGCPGGQSPAVPAQIEYAARRSRCARLLRLVVHSALQRTDVPRCQSFGRAAPGTPIRSGTVAFFV